MPRFLYWLGVVVFVGVAAALAVLTLRALALGAYSGAALVAVANPDGLITINAAQDAWLMGQLVAGGDGD